MHYRQRIYPPFNNEVTFQSEKSTLKATVEDTDESVDINGFNVYLHSDGTFSINKITSASGPDLVVPYTLTYEGKEYHCDKVSLGRLYAGGFSIMEEDEIIPLITGDVYFSEGIKKLTGSFPLNRCKRVHIPKTVAEITTGAFNPGNGAGYYRDDEEAKEFLEKYNCLETGFDLEEIIVDKDNEYYTANDGLLYTKDMKKLVACARGKVGEVVVSEGVENICNAAFGSCSKLTSIQLPSTLKSFDSGSQSGFYNCHKLKTINIPEGVETLCGPTFRYCVSLESITLPTTLKTITAQYTSVNSTKWDGVFEKAFSLKELNWENTAIEVIDDRKESGSVVSNFYGCHIDILRLPKNIHILGEQSLCYMSAPKELHLPKTIEFLGKKFINPFCIFNEEKQYYIYNTCAQTDSPLKDIYCYWQTPLDVADDIFGYVKVRENRETKEIFPQDWADICTLHVPYGTAAAYRANAVWGKFKNIVEFDSTNGIYAMESIIEPTITKHGVYTLQGVRVLENTAKLNTLPTGMYVVGGKKVFVK